MATLSGVPGVNGGLVGGVMHGVKAHEGVGVAARELADELGAVVAGEWKNCVIVGCVAAAAMRFIRFLYVSDVVAEQERFWLAFGAISPKVRVSDVGQKRLRMVLSSRYSPSERQTTRPRDDAHIDNNAWHNIWATWGFQQLQQTMRCDTTSSVEGVGSPQGAKTKYCAEQGYFKVNLL